MHIVVSCTGLLGVQLEENSNEGKIEFPRSLFLIHSPLCISESSFPASSSGIYERLYCVFLASFTGETRTVVHTFLSNFEPSLVVSHGGASDTLFFFLSAETMTSTYAASRTDSVLYILTFMSEKDYEDYQFEYRSRLVRCALSSLFRPDTSRIRWKRIFTFQVYFVDDYL